jgi:hypothetical protein
MVEDRAVMGLALEAAGGLCRGARTAHRDWALVPLRVHGLIAFSSKPPTIRAIARPVRALDIPVGHPLPGRVAVPRAVLSTDTSDSSAQLHRTKARSAGAGLGA